MTWNKPVALRDSDILQHRPISAGELDQRIRLETKTTWFCKIPVRKGEGVGWKTDSNHKRASSAGHVQTYGKKGTFPTQMRKHQSFGDLGLLH